MLLGDTIWAVRTPLLIRHAWARAIDRTLGTGEMKESKNDSNNSVPVARDLRQSSAAMKIITDMERVGDHAVNIAEWVFFAVTGEHKGETLRFGVQSTMPASGTSSFTPCADLLLSEGKGTEFQHRNSSVPGLSGQEGLSAVLDGAETFVEGDACQLEAVGILVAGLAVFVIYPHPGAVDQPIVA